MPRFRFVAADSTGQVSDGTIDAATQTDARNKLASNGLAVRELEEAAGPAGPAPPDVPRRAAARPVGSSGAIEPLPMKRPRAESPGGPHRSSPAALLFSIVALVVALASAAYVVYRDPPWGRLSRYDFSTAERAHASHLRIEANGDLHAQMELYRKLGGKQIREKLDTLRIEKTRDYHGKTVLFVEYQSKGNPVREVAYYEKDPDLGNMWKRTFVNEQEIQQVDARLAREIQAWRNMGGFGAHPPPFDD